MPSEPNPRQLEEGAKLVLAGKAPSEVVGVSLHAAEFEQLLRAAAAVHGLVDRSPNPAVKARVRNLFMAEVNSRRVAWVHSHALPHRSRPVKRPFKISSVWGVAAGLVLAVIAGVGLAGAANISEPDSRLYPLKRGAETALLAVSSDSGARADLQVKLADQRLREAETMAARNRPDLAVTLVREHYQALRQAAQELMSQPTPRNQRWTQIRDRLGQQESQSLVTLEQQLARGGGSDAAAQVSEEVKRFDSDRQAIDKQLVQPKPSPQPAPKPSPGS